MASQTGDWSIRDLVPEDVPELFGLCPGCVYWELPLDFPKKPPSEERQTLKTEWLRRCGTRCALGKTLRIGADLRGFVQFGPPELYPQRLTYGSGPISADAMLVTCLIVAATDRGHGYASALLAAAEETALTRGYGAVEAFARRGTDDNPSGPVGLYLARGYTVLRENGELPLVRKGIGSPRAGAGASVSLHSAADDFYCREVLSGRTAVDVVAETDDVLAFHHTRPYWPVHIVVIPKVHVPSLTDLGLFDEKVLTDLISVVRKVAARVEAEHGACRVLTNLGRYQDSKHLHFHVSSGEPLRRDAE